MASRVGGHFRWRDSPWLRLLGPDYIEMAFRYAAEADPAALLVYNDTSLEYDTSDAEGRRQGVLRLLRRLKRAGVRIDCLGLQSHLHAFENTKFNARKLTRFLDEVHDLGLRILLSELDVDDDGLPPDVRTRDCAVAEMYRQFLNATLPHPGVTAVITWGLVNKYSYLSNLSEHKSSYAPRPLPFDNSYQKTMAWQALAEAFSSATPR